MSFQSVSADSGLLAQRQHPSAGVLLPEAVELAFHVLGNNRAFFDEMRHLIRPSHFTKEENIFAAVWQVMCRLADSIAGRFVFESLSLSLRAHMTTEPTWYSTPELERDIFGADPNGMLWAMTHTEYGPEHIAFARQILQRFLQERAVVVPLRDLLVRHDYPQNISEILSAVHEQSARITGMNVLPRAPVAPVRGTTILKPALIYRRTGTDFVDNVLGGQVEGDCCGIIGPTGGGKTSIAVHMAVSTAQACWGDAGIVGAVPDFVVYVTVEESAEKLRPRIWSSAFSIPIAKLRTLPDWSHLTTAANMEPYEHVLGVSSRGGPASDLPSESERYDANQPWLASCLEVLDFSGSVEFPNAGRGWVPEIISALDQLQQLRQQRIRSVYIDYAGLLVERHLGGSLDEKRLRLGLKRIGDECRMGIAQRFGCTVWLLHQLSGASGAASPLKLMSHHDAGESKDFANQLTVCGCLSPVDPMTGCRRFNWSKTRNTRNEGVAPLTLRIHELFAKMEDVTGQYQIDDTTRRFISRSEAAQIQGMPAPGTTPAAARPRAGAAAMTQQLMSGPPGLSTEAPPS